MAGKGYPSWLSQLLADPAPPPKLFAWSLANVFPGATDNVDCAVSSGSSSDDEGYASAATDDFASDCDSRIFIIGAGNVGRLYASYMAQHHEGLPITLVVHRRELLLQWDQCDGVLIDRVNGTQIKSNRFNVEWWTTTKPPHGQASEVADGGKLRSVFISTKADAALAEADRIRRYLSKSSSVVFAQNGVSKLWPPYGPLYVSSRYRDDDAPAFSACVVNHGVRSAGPFWSIHTSPANAFIGPILCTPELTQRQARKRSTGALTKYMTTTPLLETKAVSSGELWLIQLEKLVMNAAINPLTTILRCKTGQLFGSYDSQDPLTRVLDKLLGQASAVIQALIMHGVSDVLIASYMETSRLFASSSECNIEDMANVRRKLRVRFSQPILKAKLYAFGLKISQHRSSMMQDMEAGRKTEIRDVNGWIIDMAEFLDIELDVSVHERLVELIEACEVLSKEELARRVL